MAVLAIEGHKKLEAAQQELYDAFSACFKTVNGRSVETWQPHETIMLCNDTTFFDLTGLLNENSPACFGPVILKKARKLAARLSIRGYTDSTSKFRILAPTAILGYGFPEASFDAAVRDHAFNLIAVDAGSIDPGPYYLATRTSFTALNHVLRDLRLMLKGVIQQAAMGQPCKLIVGSAGGCGTDNQVELLAREVRAIMSELGMVQPIATVRSEICPSKLAGRTMTSLGPMNPISTEDLRGSVIVAQMGLEPIMSALGHADIVLCGRAYDPAVFAAEPVRCGFPASAALHAAKVLECGAIATVPGSGSDCLIAELDKQGAARFWAPNPQRQATTLSVAAHTLYEKSHPHVFGLPGGVLNTKQAVFKQHGRVVEVKGTRLTRIPPTVKLEGAKVRGFRAVAIDLLPDTPDLPDVEAGNGVIVFGRNGVEDSVLNSGEQELGIVITVTGGGLERNRSHLALLRATLLHWGFDGRKATAGNLAFPFSPSDLQFGDEGVLTLCGTRDPSFISRWPQILKEVEEYVRSLSSHEDLTVRFVAAGLDGLGFLKCREVVASTAEAASAGLQVDARAIQTWQCHGSVAADYTIHHLLELDDVLLRDFFPIQVRHSDGSVQDVEATLLPWDDAPIVSSEEAYSDWESSVKPAGWRAASSHKLGDLAKVVRSKNAGVNEITYDIMFADEKSYMMAKSSPSLDASVVPLRNVLGVFCDDSCWAIKITCARQVLAGSAGDRDVYGAQQHCRCSLVLVCFRQVGLSPGVAALARARGLYLEGDLTTENLAETVFRTQLLGELLADLQACRLMAKKYCCTDLRLELSDKATSEAKDVIEDIAKVFGFVAYAARRGGKGAYKGKSSAQTEPADEKVQALDEIAAKIEGDASLSSKRCDHLLYPYWNLTPDQEKSVNQIMEVFNKEYSVRRKVLTRRLDVTIQAFLWSPKADSYMEQISQAISAVMDWRDHLSEASIGSWHMLATDEKTVQEPPKISSITALKSVVKTIIIGAVPDRGGVPEGYTVEDIAKDIVKANVALTKKDQGGGGKGASAQTAAAMSAKRWVGKGMGSGDARDSPRGLGHSLSRLVTWSTKSKQMIPVPRASGEKGGGGGYYGGKGSVLSNCR
ncbi:Fam98a [Symbiodinium natans]|uniref:Fam98a protein n=1 Tax=Symbiodinium natans TaxID=878477 RepID=A0A812P1S2_9DINO|nr:Fam98a [Symbiodinium natans]